MCVCGKWPWRNPSHFRNLKKIQVPLSSLVTLPGQKSTVCFVILPIAKGKLIYASSKDISAKWRKQTLLEFEFGTLISFYVSIIFKLTADAANLLFAYM